jgi:hypothetical protein
MTDSATVATAYRHLGDVERIQSTGERGWLAHPYRTGRKSVAKSAI